MRWLKRGTIVAVLLASVTVGASVTWIRLGSAGHLHEVSASPEAPTVIVFGAQLASDRSTPLTVLRNRLDTAAALLAAGRASTVLVSGDGSGTSGDEISAMTTYLLKAGVEAQDIVADPDGVDTYHTCLRARDEFGVRRALLVSQAFHVPRAVALCRSLGIDADGVYAGCADCLAWTMVWNTARDWLAAPKAVWEANVGPLG